jgi:hypothetical protein
MLRVFFAVIALLLGGAQAWIGRLTIAEDGLSYIEIGEAYFRGDWEHAINGYWSPFYSWILGFALRMVHPSRLLESSTVHFVNFAIYIVAIFAFDFFLKQLLVYKEEIARRLRSEHFITLSNHAWIVLAYGLFLFSSLKLITVSIESPDILLSIFLYLAGAILIRIHLGKARWGTFGLLGIVLGLGYLAKSALFPLAFAILAVGFFLIRNSRQALPRLSLSLAAFAVVSSPFIVELSISKGRPTFGDAGKLAYAWYTNGDGQVDSVWHMEFPDDHRPEHPTQKIFNSPAIYAYGTGMPGTYPPYYDPSYWHSGVVPHFDLRGQESVIKRSIRQYLELFFEEMPFFIFGAIVLHLTSGSIWKAVLQIKEHWLFLLPAFAAFIMYGFVRVSSRYVAVFLVFFWVAVFLGVRLPDSKVSRRLMDVVAIAIVMMVAIQFSSSAYSMMSSLRSSSSAEQGWQWKIAEGLKGLGIQPGDKVAVVGYAPSAYWARLADVQIVAEALSERMDFLSVTDIDKMLMADGSLKPDVVKAFAGTGARAIVANNVPSNVSRNGWRDLGIAPWFVYPLPR